MKQKNNDIGINTGIGIGNGINTGIDDEADDFIFGLDFDNGLSDKNEVEIITIKTIIVDKTDTTTAESLKDIANILTDAETRTVINMAGVPAKKEYKVIPNWFIPIIKNKEVVKETDKKHEPTVLKLKTLMEKTSNFVDNLVDFTTLYKSTGSNPIPNTSNNSRHNANIKVVPSAEFSDSIDGIDMTAMNSKNGYLLAVYRLYNDVVREVREYSDNIKIELQRKKYKKYDNIRITNSDIISRNIVVDYEMKYNVTGYLKIPVGNKFVSANKIGANSRANKCELLDNKICVINNDVDLMDAVIQELIQTPKKSRVYNYYDAVKLFRYYDIGLHLLTGHVFSKLIHNYNPRMPRPYQPLFFFSYADDADEADEVPNNVPIDVQNVNRKQLKSHIEILKIKLEKIKKNIPNDADITSCLSIILIKNDIFINCNNNLIPYDTYLLHKKAQVIKARIKALEQYLPVMPRNRNINNSLIGIIPTAKVISIPTITPSKILCKVRNNYRYRDIYYLNRIFTIDYRDQCILLETGEELWCKHELYHNKKSQNDDNVLLQKEYQVEVNGVIKCKFCETIFDEKIDSASGFTALGKPNQVQSGNLYQDLNIVFIIIEGILNTYTKISDDSKNSIRNILADYYSYHSKIEKLMLAKTMTSIELYNIIGDIINRYREHQQNTNKEIDREFNLQADEILSDIVIKKYYALAFFYMFADIVSKIIICHEIITKVPINNALKKFSTLYDINKLDLEKKYNFTYFLERYNPLDKNEYMLKYSRKFYTTASDGIREKINAKTLAKTLPKKVSDEEIAQIESKTTRLLTMAYNNVIEYNNEIAQAYSKIAKFIIKNIYYNVEGDNRYNIKETQLQDYESQGLQTAMGAVGLLMTDSDNLLYQNNKLINQDTLDIDYEANKKYIDNYAELLSIKNLIKWPMPMPMPSENFDLVNPNRIRYASFIKNAPAMFSIGAIFKLRTHSQIAQGKGTGTGTGKGTGIGIGIMPIATKYSYGISKSLSSEIVSGLYLNKNISVMTEFLNTIKIILSSDGRKHMRTMGLGDFIVNVPFIKQRKIELSNELIDEEDKMLSMKTPDYVIEKDDIENIAGIVGLKINNKYRDAKTDDVIISKNNHVNNLNSSYIGWYNLFKYLTAPNKFTESAEAVNQYSKIKKIKEGFNKLNPIKTTNPNILENVSIKNLRTIYSKYKINKMSTEDTTSDNFATFTNILYRNNLICALYQYVIDYIGISYTNFIDINTIYAENKTVIDTVKDSYTSMFEYIYRTNKINNALNETFNLYNDEMEMKKIKKMFLYQTQAQTQAQIQAQTVIQSASNSQDMISAEIYGILDGGVVDDGILDGGDVDDVDVDDVDGGNMIEELDYEEEQLDGDGNMEEDDYNFEEEAELIYEAEIDYITTPDEL